MCDCWPPLPYAEWRDTCATLHMWLQIAGKVRLALAPHLNHYWEATFYPTARGLTSSAIPLPNACGVFEIEFDFLAARVTISTSAGAAERLPLRPQTVAAFERDFLAALDRLGIAVKIWPMPVEVPHPLRFDLDETHASFDAEAARRWWRVVLAASRVMQVFRGRFQGKSSPVHLFWGSMDLAVTRFNGQRAPERPGADKVTRDAYSHAVISAGFWGGSDEYPTAAFYAYAAPEPEGFRQTRILPPAAFYEPQLGEFILRYDDLRLSPNPEAELMAFLQSTYEAAATLAAWDRAALECELAPSL